MLIRQLFRLAPPVVIHDLGLPINSEILLVQSYTTPKRLTGRARPSFRELHRIFIIPYRVDPVLWITQLKKPPLFWRLFVYQFPDFFEYFEDFLVIFLASFQFSFVKVLVFSDEVFHRFFLHAALLVIR